MYCLFELLTVACLVVFVAGILFVVCAALRPLYRTKNPAISSYRGRRGGAATSFVGPSGAGPGPNAVRPYNPRRGRPAVRRGDVDICGGAMVDFLSECLQASSAQSFQHKILPAPTGPHPMPSDPISAPDVAGGITQPVTAPLTRAAIFLVTTVKPGTNHCAAVRSLCGDLVALMRAVGVSRP